MSKYHIHTQVPGQEIGSHCGYSRTLDAAVKRAEKLTGEIRSDLHVVVVHDGAIVARTTGISSAGPAPRRLQIVGR